MKSEHEIKTYKMSEEAYERSSSECESKIDSIDLLMESYVNLLELFKELKKDSKKNRELLEDLSAKLEQMERN